MINQLFGAYGPQGGALGQGSGGSPMSLLFMFIGLIVPILLVCRRLAKEKGKRIGLYTILGIIPLVNYFALFYLIGTTNTMLEEKIDKVLSLMEKQQENKTEENKQE